jgi:uncharacterized protein YndB with AHSA1/START domain
MTEYGQLIEAGTLRLERLLPGPIERVWAYITESDKRAKWFAEGKMELKAGGKMKLEFHHENLMPPGEEIPEKFRKDACGGNFPAEILECEPPRLLTFTWPEEEGEPSQVTFALTPKGDKVHLVLTHRRLKSRAGTVNVSGGWHLHLDLLQSVLEGAEPGPFWGKLVQLQEHYDRLTPTG